MTDPTPVPPPEGILLRRARESWHPRKLPMRRAAVLAGVSETTWRHTELGAEPKGGLSFAYRAGADTLARMSDAVHVSPEQLEGAGRGDAADVLREIQRRSGDGEDAAVTVLRGALSAGEQHIMNTATDPQFAAELIRAFRAAGIDDLIRQLAERQRQRRTS